MTAGHQPVTIVYMNVIDTQAIWHHASGPVRWAVAAAAPPGGGFHNIGEILLALLVLGGLSFTVTRLRRGRRAAPHDDQRVRREPPMGMRQRLGVACGLLGDPELLILDEPMNGLDPAGMHEMRAMIATLTGEGRTVVLSSHLLDEVERTCDAVAIVDHGRVIRQGPIDELIRGAGAMVVQVDCAEPARAAQLINDAGIAAGTALSDAGLTVTLPAGASRELVADINQRLVGAGIPVYDIREIQTSLEDWFLSVTSRLGEPS